MPSKSKAQAKLMRAVAHGWNPSRIKGPTRQVAEEFVRADKRRKGKARGGRIGGVAGTVPRPGGVLTGRPLPRPGGGSTGGRGGLGSSGIVGALGSSLRAGKPLAAKPTRPSGPLSGVVPRAIGGIRSNVRPRPGRGVNPRLALSGTTFHEAEDRLSRLGRAK